jgi:hypothetical protein
MELWSLEWHTLHDGASHNFLRDVMNSTRSQKHHHKRKYFRSSFDKNTSRARKIHDVTSRSSNSMHEDVWPKLSNFHYVLALNFLLPSVSPLILIFQHPTRAVGRFFLSANSSSQVMDLSTLETSSLAISSIFRLAGDEK